MKLPSLNSTSVKIWLFLFVVALVKIIVVLWFNVKNMRTYPDYEQYLSELRSEDGNLRTLNDAQYDILIAENYYRDYLATGDSTSRQQFAEYLQKVSTDLEQVKDIHTSFPGKVQSQIGSKLEIAETISSLKGMADTLLRDTYAYEHQINAEDIKLGRISTSLIKSSIVHSVDTLKVTKEKRGLLRKIFGGKDSDSATVELSQGQVTETGDEESTTDEDSEEAMESYENLATNVTRYYQQMLDRQMRLRKEVDAREKEMAAANFAIISQIRSGIDDVTAQVEQGVAEKKDEIHTELQKLENQKKWFIIMSIPVSIFVMLIIFFSIRLFLRYENSIVRAKEDALNKAQIKARLLSNMSHEIRSPLTAVMGFAEQLMANPSVQNSTDYIGAIKSSSEHLLSTVNDILDYSKLDVGKFHLVKEEFDLRQVLEEVVFNFSILAEKKKLYLRLNTDIPKDTVLMGDEFRLKQILYNFISNAIKFTNKGGVEVEATLENSENDKANVVIKVKDTGIGIPADQLEYIFEEFTQVNNNVSTLYTRRGTGLGLYISKTLAELQGGKVKVDSEFSKGSTFTVSIPFAYSKLRKRMAPLQETPKGYEYLRGKKVLLVEDNEMNRKLLGFILNKYGMPYDIAESGTEAWDSFSKKKYDLVLTDINIPGIPGNELAAKIRTHTDHEKAHVPVIALTADVGWEDSAKYEPAGIDAVVSKPFREADVIEMISKYLREDRYSLQVS